MKGMKLLLVGLLVILLAGCSGMTRRDQCMVGGAVVGGVAGSALSGGSGVGTVGGAAVGGYIGHESCR